MDRLEMQARVQADIISREVQILGLKRGVQLLDAGCGTGAVTRFLAASVAPTEVCAVDMDAGYLDEARKLAERYGITNVRFDLQDIEDLKLPDQTFDVSYCRLVLYHVSDPLKAVGELKRVTKKMGVVAIVDEGGVLTYPYLTKFETLVEKRGRWWNSLRTRESQNYRNAYSVLSAAGLSPIEVHPIPTFASQESPEKLRQLVSVPLKRLEIDKEPMIANGFVTEQEYVDGIEELKSFPDNPSAFWMLLSVLTIGACTSMKTD